MDPEQIREEVRALIAEIIERDASDVADETPLRELGVDSMQAIEIITDLEKRYKIKIAESEYRNVSTLANITSFLQAKIAAR